MKKLNRFEKQRINLIEKYQMRLKFLEEYKSLGVSLYDNEIILVENNLNNLKKSKKYNYEDNIHE